MAIAPWLNFHGIGRIGVYLFFVLSGFLLTRNLMAGQSSREFIIARFFRIAPLYYLVLIGVFFLQAFGFTNPLYLHFSGDFKAVGLHFLFLQGDGVFWTIAAEFIFYLFLPAIFILVVRFGTVFLIVFSTLYFGWYFAYLLGADVIPPKIVRIPHGGQFLDVFLLGVVAAFIKRDLPHGIVAVAFWSLLFLTLVCVARSFLIFDQEVFMIRSVSLLYGVVFALAIASAAQGSRWHDCVFKLRALRFVGITGFGWYLFHFAVLQAINATIKTSPGIKFLISALGTALVSWLAFVIVEKPFIKIGRRLSNSDRRSVELP